MMNIQYFPVYDCKEDMSIHCDFIYILTILEVVAFFLLSFCYGVAIYTCMRAPFHYNLVFIGTFMLSGFYTYAVGRAIICLHEIGVFKIEMHDADKTDAPFVFIIAGFLQFFYMTCACGISLAISFERYFATYFVDSYEVQKRKWVSSAICVEFTIAAGLTAYIILFDLIPLYVMIIIGLIVSCISFIFYNALFFENRRWFDQLMKLKKNDKYTLSLRFQLNENLQAMTLLRNVVVYSGTSNFIMGFLLVAKSSECVQKDYPVVTIYLHLVFNTLSVLYAYNMLLILLLSVKSYRVYFFSIRIIKFLTAPIFGKCFESDFSTSPVQKLTVSSETELYFNSLASQWDEKWGKVAR